MSLTGCSSSEKRVEIIKKVVSLVASEAEDVNDCLSILATTLGTVVGELPPENNQIAINQIVSYLHQQRMPVHDNRHCPDCRDANDVIDSILNKLGHMEPQLVAVSLARCLRIIMDSVGDDDLAEDINEEIIDVLFPDENPELESLH